MNNPVNLVSQKQKVRHQQGFASLLFVLLIGLSLVIIILGVFLGLRGLQDSTITSHAQTQAEERSMIGAKALSNFLYNLNSTQIAALQNGTITDKNGTLTGTAGTQVALYARHTETPPTSSCYIYSTTQYCFDVTASSGGASATIRTVYQRASTIGSNTLTGSVFAGGLIESGNAIQFKGDTATNPVTISTGGAYAGQICGDNQCNTNKMLDNNTLLTKYGIKVTTYQSTTFVSAEDLKTYSNYIFTSSGVDAYCTMQNLYNPIHTDYCIKANDFLAKFGLSYSYNTKSKTSSWEITDPTKLPVGVLWFDSPVTIDLTANAPFVNTIISKGSINATPTAQAGYYYVFSPYYFYKYYSVYNSSLPSSSTQLTSAKALATVCSTIASGNIPSQYCNADGTFNDNALQTVDGSLANILFLTNGGLTLNAANNATLNFYGNIIASNGAGGTGSPSGDFTGTGNINITGNIVIAGSTTTTLSGSMNIDLSQTTASNSTYIPSYTYANSLRFIKYM